MTRRLLIGAALVAILFLGLGPNVNLEVISAQAPPKPWVGLPVPDSNLMVWIQGTEEELRKYRDMAELIWKAYPPFFTYPLPDKPGLDVPLASFNSRLVNPDSRVDIYLIDSGVPDPRKGSNCQDCAIGQDPNRPNADAVGEAREADPTSLGGRTSSGYVLVKKTIGDDRIFTTMAHELAHVAQGAYDWDERKHGEPWLHESTAEWVAYKVTIALKKSRMFEYQLLDRRLPSHTAEGLHPPLFQHLHEQVHRTGNHYSGFLFFFYASQAIDDDVVKRVWKAAAAPGAQGIRAVDQVINLAEHFPQFAVRNWNHEYLPERYEDDDPDFPPSLVPEPVQQMPSGLGTFELSHDTTNLAARYYRFVWSDAKVRRVTLQNFYSELPDAHVWAIKKIGVDWKEPEDWSRKAVTSLCRDESAENVTELVLVVSNSHLTLPISRIDPQRPKPRMLVEDVGCAYVEGSAKSTLRLKDERQDVTYESSTARLRFRSRGVQDMPGNVQYDLMPTLVTWTVSGTQDGCTLSGSTVATIPALRDEPLDPTRPAYGYLNVVGVDGGDFHSVQVSAVNPAAMLTRSCPDGVVTQEPFRAVWLLNVLSQTNTHTGATVEFSGTRTFDPDRFQDSLPQAARDFLQGTTPLVPTPPQQSPLPTAPGGGTPPEVGRDPLTGLPPDIDLAEVAAAMARARQALQEADLKAGRVVYTFTWDLGRTR